MQHEFRGQTLAEVVAKAVRPKTKRYQTKSATTIEVRGGGRVGTGRISAKVEKGRHYTISWKALKPASDGGALYMINISSFDGLGSYRDTFEKSGSASFTAGFSGTAQFGIEVAFSAGSVLGKFPVVVSID